MARKHCSNFNDVGHAHELTFTCYKRFPFLGAERTCQWLIESINEARMERGFDLWAYVFMPEHVHLILCPRAAPYDIAAIRKAIKAPVGLQALKYIEMHAPEWLPTVTRRRGNKSERLFWQSGGGYDRNITDAATLLSMINYLHLNPVRRRLASRPEDWLWSSARWYEGKRDKAPIAVDAIPSYWLSGA
jgi:putative transposase